MRAFGAATAAQAQSLYSFSAMDLTGRNVSLDKYRTSPVALVVNTASGCPTAGKSFPELQALYDKYKDQGFVILGFPCSQFLGEEPISNEDMPKYLARKGITFPVFARVNVNGDDAHPLFKWLKGAAPGTLFDAIKWNFTKFLLLNGMPIKRFGPTDMPHTLEDDIKQALREAANTPHVHVGKKEFIQGESVQASQNLDSMLPGNAKMAARTAADSVRETAEDVREGADSMIGSIKQTARNAAHRVEDTIESAKDSVTGLGDSVRTAARSAAAKVEDVYEAGKERVEEAVDSAKGSAFGAQRRASDVADSARASSESILERGKNAAADAVDSVKEAARSAKRGLDSTIGKATGAVESQSLGDRIASNTAAQGHEFGDAVPLSTVEKAKRFVSEKLGRGKEAAEDLADSARDTARSAVRNLDATVDSAKATARDAANTAKRSLEDTVDSAKDAANSARRSVEDTVDSAKSAASRAQRNLASNTAAVGHEHPSESLGDAAVGAAESAKRFVSHKWEQGKEAAAEAVDSARGSARSAKRNLDASVEDAKAGARDARRSVEYTLDSAKDSASAAQRNLAANTAAQGHESMSGTVGGMAESAKRFVAEKWEQGKEAVEDVVDSARGTAHQAKRNLGATVDDAAAGARETARRASSDTAALGHEVGAETMVPSDSVLGSARSAARSVVDSVRNVASRAAGFVTGRGEAVVEEKRTVGSAGSAETAAYPKVRAAQANMPGQGDQGSIDLSARQGQAQQNPAMGPAGGQAAADALKGDQQWRQAQQQDAGDKADQWRRAQQQGDAIGDMQRNQAQQADQQAAPQRQAQRDQQAAADKDRRMPRSVQDGLGDRDLPQGVHEGQRRLDPHPGATLDPIQAAKTVLPRGAARAAQEFRDKNSQATGGPGTDASKIPRVPAAGQPEVPRTEAFPGSPIPDEARAQNPDRPRGL